MEAHVPTPVTRSDATTAEVPVTRPQVLDLDASPPAPLVELAHACGVATEFWDWRGRHVQVSTRTIAAVLAALDIDVAAEGAVEAALATVRERGWRRVLPDVVVTREGASSSVPVHVEHEQPVEVWIELEGGGRRPVEQADRWVEPRLVDGRMIGEATFRIPDDLPLGWHTLNAKHPGGEVARPLVVTPTRLELPDAVAEQRQWGFATQLYSIRSSLSWGLGDIADLAELATWSARAHGAGFVVVNPLHAAEPVPPMESS